ncbi:MAG: proline dehydrogenase family protein [Planctomycetota bacterium]|nr:proline dehydrogenase family protein [Planctomycetota bacterium]
MSLLDQVVRLSLPVIPKPIIWAIAKRYVAGSELPAALERIRAIRKEGFGTILDVLGEGVVDAGEAAAALAEYELALSELPEVDPTTTVSVKPTHLGATNDQAACVRMLSQLCSRAADQGRRVRLEMEGSETIDVTLGVFREVRASHANLGCVLQSRLFRTAGDAAALLSEFDSLDVRLVKGIYLEPKEIAWTEPAAISRSYVELAAQLLEGGARVGFATHDSDVADACIEVARKSDLVVGDPWGRKYEFQLLMGVRQGEAERLRNAGHAVRIYVPYGRDWHAYTQRRLARNPEIARHVLRALFLRK